MGERTEARRAIEASRARMSVIADELARRSSPDYLRGRAREAAMIKASNARQRAASNPGALAAIGALAGGTLGMALAKKAKSRREQRFYESGGGFRTAGVYVSRDFVPQPSYEAGPAYTPRYGYGYAGAPDYSTSPEVSTVGAESWSEPYRTGEAERSWEHAGAGEFPRTEEPSRGEQIKEKAGEIKERMSGKAEELKHRMSDRSGGLKERMSEKTDELKHRMSDKTDELRHRFQERSHGPGLRERMPSGDELRGRAQERPLGVIAGGILFGALAATLLPLTRRERKVMHPAKERARHELGDQWSSFEHRVEEKLGFAEREERGRERQWRGGEQQGQWPGGEQGRTQEPGAPAPSWHQEGTFSSTSTTSPGGTYASTTSDTGPGMERTSREELGLRNQGDRPYRQPSVAEQLDEPGKARDDKIH